MSQVCPRDGTALKPYAKGGYSLALCQADGCNYGTALVTHASRAPSKTKRTRPTVDGRTFANKREAAVYVRLKAELTDDRDLFVHPRFLLLNLAPNEIGTPSYFCPDFAITRALQLERVVDAKPAKWRSRDWPRGKRAFEAAYRIRVEEVQA